ncbi:MAG TPA: Gfo/Idh/MocA family oxidoreductase, partial [Chthoniobacterales bacterium]
MSPRSKLKKLRFALAGTGAMANFHAQQLNAIPGVKIAAVCDVDEARVREFAAKYGVEEIYTDFDALLRQADFDALANVTPDAFHAPLTLKALAAKKHVLCEKPLATHYADAKKMADAAKKAGVIHLVNFSYRKSGALQKAREFIQAGRIGRVVHVEGSYLQSWLACDIWGPWRTTPAWLWRQSTRHGSKGVLGDVGVHLIDFASFPVGPIQKVHARLKTFTGIKG